MTGEWSGTEDSTEEVQKICDEVKPDVEKMTNKTFEEFTAKKYRHQIVAGTNYLIKVHVGGSSYIHIQLFQSLPCNGGALNLFGVQENHTENDPLDLFPPFSEAAQ
ncbi:cystatin-B-like [Anabas testudineus]|uniref:Cystatin-B n=1 Tax=Anabas testudineus TaxID=64144 RepID=A0A3Q1IRU2_ANATE|nr:cystatin-B-like [Anabas testudineus]